MNVETIFDVRRTVWNGLGSLIQDAPTSDDAIRLAGLDWKVLQDDVYDSVGNKINGYKLNYRSTDNKPLGIVTPKYKIVQNDQAFAFTDALLGEGVTYETAGSLASGKRVWMLARLEDRNITDELISPYLVFTNTHDGSGSVKVAITPVRVVCQNTLNMALKQAERHWSCVHMGNINSKLEEARATLLNTEKYLKEMENSFIDLKKHKMNMDQVNDFVSTLIPMEDDVTNITKVRNVINMRDELLMRYEEAPDLIDTEHTAFRVINAVSDFATHREPLRHTANYQENLFMHTVDGNDLIDRAYKILQEAV